MPTRAESLSALTNYESQMRSAIEADQHHDQRRAILQELLRDGFDLSVEEVELERNVRVAKTRGRIDLLYGSLAWEVKRDLDREREDLERELKLYLTDLGAGAIGIGTDGLRFEVFQLDSEGELRQTDGYSIDAPSASLDEALSWIDAYVFALDEVAPTTESILSRFGVGSAVFSNAELELQALWHEIATDPSAAVKRDEWERLLEVVYGTQVASDSLWLRHTYLVMVARLLAYLAIVERLPEQGTELGALTGELFTPLGLSNLVERDFFAWPAEGRVADRSRLLLRGLAHHLGLFSVGRIDEDLLKELYEHMVDPAEREWLGEFYTPDWLADLVLERAGFDENTRMLDPSCGSGTFLFAAIRRLRRAGLSGADLVRRARRNILGFELHPLAVTTARANYVLALRGDIREAGEELVIPVFMADTLAVPAAGFGRMVEVKAPVDGLEPASGEQPLPDRFQLPTEHDPEQEVGLGDIVALVDQLADPSLDPRSAATGLRARLEEWGVRSYVDVWEENLRLLRTLRANHRDTIWSFVLTNAARPHELAADPVDLIAGNPPWLTVREMAGSGYRDRVRALADEFNLVPSGGARMAHVSHIDTATVFAMFCAQHFLPNEDGRVAFVLPRSVMAGATQHKNFREGRAAFLYAPVAALDLDAVEPLFRIPASVMIFDKVEREGKPEVPWQWPTRALAGQLPRKNADRSEADAALTESEGEAATPTSPSPYVAQTQQGADMRPRAFCIVEADPSAKVLDRQQPYLRSDSQAVADADPAWRGVSIDGRVEARFLYATSLRVDPFRIGPLRLAALPIEGNDKGEVEVLQQEEILARGHAGMARWLAHAEEEFRAVLEKTEREWKGTVVDYLNTQSKLGRQKPLAHRVVWGKGGTHIRAAVPPSGIAEAQGLPVHGYIIDLSCYGVVCASQDEAHYLCAVLNSTTAGDAIAYHQTRGEQGRRDIHRRPVQHVPIPVFDHGNRKHSRLAELSLEAHSTALSVPFDSRYRAERYREALGEPLREIDRLANEVLQAAYRDAT